MTDDPMGPAKPGPPEQKKMADPKLVLEAEPDDIVLESIKPEGPALGSAPPAVRAPPRAAAGSSPHASPGPGGSRGPVVSVPKAPRVGPLAPPPAPGSNPRNDRPPPPPPTRGTPASGVNPRAFGASKQQRTADPSNIETIPAPPREGSASGQVPGSVSERSSVTARDLAEAANRSLPQAPLPHRLAPGSVQVPASTLGSSMPSATPAGPTRIASVTSGSFSLTSYSGVHQQSALVRLLSPFIEDPRPRWLLAIYFLVGIAAGVGAAFGLWGQN